MSENKAKAAQQRHRLLARMEAKFEWPMILLALAWLVLLIVELVQGLSTFWLRVGEVIWAIFIADFILRLVIAPDKGAFFRSNWLTLIALVLPALRVLRFARVLRAARGVRLVRIFGSINRGMRSLGRTMERRGLGYVLAATVIVSFTGAAGMYAFEKGAPGFGSYGETFWWTAMLLTTMGSGYWPETLEGRVLSFFLSLYALGILGYVAGSLATLFIGKDVKAAGAQRDPT